SPAAPAGRSYSSAPAARSLAWVSARPWRAAARSSPARSAPALLSEGPRPKARAPAALLRGTSGAWLWSRCERSRLDAEVQLEEVGRRRLDLAHPGLRRALGGEVVWCNLNLLATFLIGIDAHLVGLLVRWRRIVLLLLLAFFLLGLQRGGDDRAIGLCGGIL